MNKKFTQKIRNFCIIAHIDHGKSTLADRLLEYTKTIEKRDMKHNQILDTMELEQERGITIKLQPVRMDCEFEGEKYILNLIDTPGHVDFSYEVSRSLAACEGAILVVDATQGIQAQTLANCYMAIDHNLTIIPVINKIDLPSADVERVAHEIENTLAIPKEEIIPVSAKDGTNIETLLQAVIKRIPAPVISASSADDEFKALIFDSVYDLYKGVVAYIRVKAGSVKKGDKVWLLNTKQQIEIIECGYFKPHYKQADALYEGEVGYIVTGLKTVAEARVGDTVWKSGSNNLTHNHAVSLEGYHIVKPYVFAGIFCSNGDDYPLLRDALEKLQLNDSSLSYTPEQSTALGHGFRCGFLGMLHLEIVQERLEREYNLNLIITAPSVSYIAVTMKEEEKFISSPSELPNPASVKAIKEPWMNLEILTPKEYIGPIMKLVQERRGINKDMQYIDQNRVILTFEIPLASIVIDFYDNLKSITSGYASMNYDFIEYREENLVKMDILVAGKPVEALSVIIHKSESYHMGMSITKKLKKLIPRAMFEIPIQAAIGAKIIARETISAMRKDVTAKLYGGDRTRKDKLLKKQKEGKKRMKRVGNIDIPQEAFLTILKRDSE
ncbi:elongation factor 4 [Candidatus Peregrinibacteria bacterium]|nr:elongation factor 4 [Candidatus Peregrinibacteria bacterium]